MLSINGERHRELILSQNKNKYFKLTSTHPCKRDKYTVIHPYRKLHVVTKNYVFGEILIPEKKSHNVYFKMKK